jgi:putative redox protein
MAEYHNRLELDYLNQVFQEGYNLRQKAGQHPVTLRATAALEENTKLSGRIGKYHFDCDEPPARGGNDTAPSPLEFFLVGTAFCMLSQLVQFAPLYQVQFYDVSIDLRATFDDSEKYNLPGPGAAFQQVTFRVKIVSPSSDESIHKLVAHAERGCHAAQSLIHPVPVTLEKEIIQA